MHAAPVDAQTRGTIVFHDVAVLTATGADPIRNQTVVVSNGRIASMQPAASAPTPARGARVIAGSGRYLAAAGVLAAPHAGAVHIYHNGEPLDLIIVDSIIAPGPRRSLILFEPDPRASPNASYAGVLLDGKWIERSESERAAEEAAKIAIRTYYRSVNPDNWNSDCKGITIYDCFAGDAECTGKRNCSTKDVLVNRGELIVLLDQLAAVHPASDWIAGHRVAFAVKQGDIESAIAIAQSCRATLWWCQALRGYSLHLAGWGGDAQLDSAMTGAPAGTLAWAQHRLATTGDRGLHCEWTDLQYMLTGRMRVDYVPVPCGENRAFEAKWYWLADPMWSIAGNDRRAEQIARNIATRMHDEILRLYGGSHPHSHHGQITPAGNPNSYRGHPVPSFTPRVRFGRPPPPPRKQYYVNGGYSFAPDESRFYAPGLSTAKDWQVRWDQGEERMITRYTWHELEHQARRIAARFGTARGCGRTSRSRCTAPDNSIPRHGQSRGPRRST